MVPKTQGRLSSRLGSGMEPPKEHPPDTAPPKPPRLDDARRIVEEYVADLRQIIKKLRRKMN
jgi:hypothetical protein